jgi:acetoin utilization deacetylase AcuC-like enzyme
MGFCIFNNVAIAIRQLQRTGALERIAVVDWDVHHGNGTQAIFYEDPDVLVISVHQDGCFPRESGLIAERGAGAGEGATVNVPLPAGAGHEAYLEAFRRVVIPASSSSSQAALTRVSTTRSGGCCCTPAAIARWPSCC